MKTAKTVKAIMEDYADEIGNKEELIAWIERRSIANVAYRLWDDVFYGKLTEEEIFNYLANLVNSSEKFED